MVVLWPPTVHVIRKYRNIVIGGACNLRCDYCDLKDDRVDVPAVCAALDAIVSRFQPETVLLRVEADGEITLYPTILDHLELIAQRGYAIEVLSNGTRLPRCLEGHPHLLWVVSIDGHTEAMNRRRGLSQTQVDAILETAVGLQAELQCVYHGQSVDEMNAFIDWLASRNYRGMLHIMPLLAFKGRPLTVFLDYEQLHHTSFLADREYFQRWRFIYENGHRGPYVCDQIKNGYNYEIRDGKILMVKCDCYSVPKHLYHPFGEEREVDNFPCGTCLANQELNNSRARMQIAHATALVPKSK
jgi:MoaA/NifB/PqqE/SkfB family radical SAM enzyme